MERHAQDEAGAFSELYDALAPRLYSFAVHSLCDQQRAETIVSATLAHLHQCRGHFCRGSSVTPLAFAILRRLLSDLSGAERRSPEKVSETFGCPAPRHRGLHRVVRDALAGLSSSQRRAVELIFYGQMTHMEAAEALGVTLRSVKRSLAQAVRVLGADE